MEHIITPGVNLMIFIFQIILWFMEKYKFKQNNIFEKKQN